MSITPIGLAGIPVRAATLPRRTRWFGVFRRRRRGEARPPGPRVLWRSSLGDVVADDVAWANAFGVWQTWRDLANGWPVILGDDDEVDRVVDQATTPSPDVVHLLDVAAALDTTRLVERWADSNEPVDDYHHHEFDVVGIWPQEAFPNSTLTVPRYGDGITPLETVTIARFPVEAAWKVFAVSNWGGWNACPGPEEHAAAHRYWQRDVGAVLACLTSDTAECVVERSPTRRQVALRLAEAQYAYCPDIVDQGVGTISALAATSLEAPVWLFWWD